MCGISGYLRLTEAFSPLFSNYIKRVNEMVIQRGPDCIGLYAPLENLSFKTKSCVLDAKNVGDMFGEDWKPLWERSSWFTSRDHKLILYGFRGIPTTEYYHPEANIDYLIQPYAFRNSIVTHNGQLSNDIALSSRYNYPNVIETSEHDIDSYYFLKILEKSVEHGGGWKEEFSRLLNEVDGSYALAAYNEQLNALVFARNFRGLHFCLWEHQLARYLVWSSEKLPSAYEVHHRSPTGTRSTPLQVYTSQLEMPQDSLLFLDLEDLGVTKEGTSYEPPKVLSHVEQLPFLKFSEMWTASSGSSKPYRSHHNENSCVVVLSGGLDSTVCATIAAKSYEHVYLIHFLYGARAEKKEVEAVKAIASYLAGINPNVKLHFLDLQFIKDLGGSSLTDKDLPVAVGEIGAESPKEWVPARNTAMIGLTAAFCDRHDIGTIILGLNMEESSAFQDNSNEFFEPFEKALQLGTHSKPRLVMPLGRSMKHHIWRTGKSIEAPLHLSWSCYHGDEVRCGTCGPCIMRQRAAAINGEQDSVEYKTRDAVAEKIVAEHLGTKHANP